MSGFQRNDSMVDDEPVAINLIKLRRLSRIQDPNELLFKLLTPDEGFLERLKQGSTGSDMTTILLKVTALACNATHQHSLIQFLRDVISGRFIQHDILELLKEYTTENTKITHSNLKDIMGIIRALTRSFPSKSLSAVSALCSMIKYIIKEKDVVKLSELEEEYERLEDELVCIRQQVQSGTVLKDQEKEDQWTVPESSNFRRLTVLPTAGEIQGQITPYLRENKIYKEYKDTTDYLDVQFRLLKEDFLRPLREGLEEIKENQLRGGDNRRSKTNMKLYTNIKICPSHCSQEGVVYRIHFDINRLKVVKWETSKRLLPGSLICLSSDDFTSILVGTIAERKLENLNRGVTHIYIDQFTNDMEILRFKKSYKMVENPGYFEPYKNVLSVLQQTEDNALPFPEYLLNENNSEIHPPKYLLNEGSTKYDFSSLMVPSVSRGAVSSITSRELLLAKKTTVPVLHLEEWPSARRLGLDESQYRALKAAVTKEFAVIQGPPGTGKTFLGLKIIQLLLENKQWEGPILIVCYTNHALDQFFEEIIKLRPTDAVSGRLVRIGHKTASANSDVFQQCSLEKLRKGRYFDNASYYCIKKQMRHMEIRIMEIMACIQVSETEILRFQALSEFMDRVYFSDSLTYLEWLCGDDEKIDLGSNEVDSFSITNHFHLFDNNWHKYIDDDYEEKENRFYNIPDYDYNDILKSTVTNNFSIFVNSDGKISDERVKISLGRAKLTKARFEASMLKEESMAVDDIWRMSVENRWRLYNYWASCFVKKARKNIRELQRCVSAKKKRLDELNNDRDCVILKNSVVVAMTTTGAAKRNDLLKQVGPRIVIVEEAAEVLEAHVVTSLSKNCEHLILIGDHQQLRPKPADYSLSKHYRLDISLFEKVVLNKMHCECLSIQHRMRPEISELLVPHIYKSLNNHKSVSRYKNVAGILGNLFFIIHSELESEEDDDKSHSNSHEAKFIASLCRYLLNVGYSASEVTVLTTYTGQHFLLKSLLQINELRITPVDNYQGEENDIILLSLVRSNLKSSIGFLEIANRVCVALSRAREGLYIIGNGELLRDRSPLWRDIVETLKKNNRYVESLPLGCRRHPDQKFLVKMSEDFKRVPLSGCIFPCEFQLKCGHVCDKICHELDENHSQYKCRKACEGKPFDCPVGHPCQKLCFENCGYCTFKVRRTLTRCGHEVEMMCHVKDEDFECNEPCEKSCPDGHLCKKRCYEKCECDELIERILPQCHHQVKMRCSQKLEKYKCEQLCNKTCPNGHPCQKKCSEICSCEEMVKATMHAWCTHETMVPCSQKDKYCCPEQCERIMCSQGHHCTKRCYQPCGSCKVIVKKQLLLCDHVVEMPCGDSLVDYKCNEQCRRSCKNGHPCGKLCFQTCGRCEIKIEKPCPKCKAMNIIECADSLKTMKCNQICKETLPCGHMCQKLCGAISCTQNCKVLVEKVKPCDHPIEVECYLKSRIVIAKCDELVELKGKMCKFGHPKMVECNTTDDQKNLCQRPVSLPCSTNNPQHEMTVPCYLQKMIDFVGCDSICDTLLECGHRCELICVRCAKSGKHDSCEEPCKRMRSLCRHPCSKPCGTPCGDCEVMDRQIFVCQHKSYHGACHEPFVPCKNQCAWKCPHFGCRMICSEPCERPPCNNPCNRKLTCTHTCVGLCGEPCPQKCWVCDNEELVSICQQLEIQPQEDERFLLLSPCDHIVAVRTMDAWVKLNAKYPPYKVDRHLCLDCPICRIKVSSCPRYNGILKRYEMHLNEAKTQISASDNMASQLSHVVTPWLQRNNYALNCVEKPKQLKRLKEATICILNEIEVVVRSLDDQALKEISQRLCFIQDNIFGIRKSWTQHECVIQSDILNLYVIYFEIQVRRMRKFVIGPSLKVLDKCTQLLDCFVDFEAYSENNFDRIWQTVKKVNHMLSTRLELHERKDKIDDYVRHLNNYYEAVQDKSFTSNWFCCSKGHVYAIEEEIDDQNIDNHCFECSSSMPTGISKILAAITDEIWRTFRDPEYPVSVEDINASAVTEVGKDTNHDHDDLLPLSLANEQTESVERSPERSLMVGSVDVTQDKSPTNSPNESQQVGQEQHLQEFNNYRTRTGSRWDMLDDEEKEKEEAQTRTRESRCAKHQKTAMKEKNNILATFADYCNVL